MIPILTTASWVICPHGGTAVLTTSNVDAKFAGAPALLLTDIHQVAGCVFTIPAGPSPCLTIRWLTGALQSKLRGVPMLLQTSIGLCLNALQAPQGPAVVVQVQQLAKGI